MIGSLDISGVLGGLAAAIPLQRRCVWFLKTAPAMFECHTRELYFNLIAYLRAEIPKQRQFHIEIQSAGPPPTPYPRASSRWRKVLV